jgi:hypothetical protein|tara:strand:+ start:819 stop:1112 length:294 start_codon:yes stop_codon:yes gene_type:complete
MLKENRKSCSKGERIRKVLTNENFRAIIFTDMDEALLGIHRDKVPYSVAVYSLIKFIEQLILKRGLTEDSALEYYDQRVLPNIRREDYPIFIDDTGV